MSSIDRCECGRRSRETFDREMKMIPASLGYCESFCHALDEVARERKYLLMVEAPPLQSVQDFVGNIIKNGWSQFYAVEDGRVVGWCDIIPHTREGLRHVGIVGIGILASHRGKGIGEKLLSQCVQDSFSKNIQRIEMEVFASNEPAIHLYKKLGFTVEGTKRNARFLDGAYDDFIIMSLLKEEVEQVGAGNGAPHRA